MQSLSKREQKQLNRGIWLAKLTEELEQIPEGTLVWHLMEKRTVLRALIQVQGNRALVARRLEITVRGLSNKLKYYGLCENQEVKIEE